MPFCCNGFGPAEGLASLKSTKTCWLFAFQPVFFQMAPSWCNQPVTMSEPLMKTCSPL